MQAFKYKGYDVTGKKVDGEMVAETIEDVERRVAAQSITVVSIFPAAGFRARSGNQSSQAKVKRVKVSDAEIAVTLRDLAVMAESGVPFVESIDAIAATARSRGMREGMARLRTEIVSGRALAGAMRESGIFPTVVSEMVKVAEEGGKLDMALGSAATYMERAADLKKKVMNALLYPMVLGFVAFATIIILITFVLPRFAEIFKTMKAEVPQSTMAMMAAGAWIRGNPILSVGMVVGTVVGFRLLWRVDGFRRGVYRLTLKVPVIGDLLTKLGLSRAMQSMATLLSTNVSLISAMEHGAGVSGNPVISDALFNAKTMVEHGGSLSDALRQSHAFPPSLIQMVSVGERTGRLGLLMQNTARYMEEDVDSRLKALIAIVEPAMIVVMGAIVGSITMSIIIPMYSVIQNVK